MIISRGKKIAKFVPRSQGKDRKFFHSVMGKILRNSPIGRWKNIAKFDNRSHEKNIDIHQSAMGQNRKNFSSDTEKGVNLGNLSQYESTQFVNRSGKYCEI